MTQPVSSWLPNLIGPVVLADEGTALPARAKINFTGAGVTATDNPAQGRTDITITSSSGGGTSLAGMCTLEQFGAVGDGVTSDQAALTAAVAAMTAGTYHSLALGAKTYLVTTGTGILPSGCSIIGQGRASVLSTATLSPLIMLNASENVVLAHFRIVGTGLQTGIQAGTPTTGVGQSNLTIEDVHVDHFNYGMVFSRTNGVVKGPNVSGCSVINCATAIITQDASEYITFTGCHFTVNLVGMTIASGNIVVTGCTIDYNNRNIELVAGSNTSHGIFTACNINHGNSEGIWIDAITNGHTFAHCHMYGTSITFAGANTKLVDFHGCHLDPFNYTHVAGCMVRYNDCRIGTDSFVSYVDLGDVEWVNPRPAIESAPLPAGITNAIHRSFSFAANANETLSASAARAKHVDIATGAAAGPLTITNPLRPSKGREQSFRNNTAFLITLQWATGTGITLTPGQTVMMSADGTNAFARMAQGVAGDGTAISTGGQIRGGSQLQITHAVSGTQRNIIEGATTADVYINDPTNGGSTLIRQQSGTTANVQIGGVNQIVGAVASVSMGVPVIGYGAGSSPWSGMNGMFVKAMAGSTYTLVGADYANSIIKVTGTGTNVIKSAAVTDAQAVMKFVWNAGTGTLAVQDANAVAAAATLAAGTGAWFLFAASAVKQMSAAFAVA